MKIVKIVMSHSSQYNKCKCRLNEEHMKMKRRNNALMRFSSAGSYGRKVQLTFDVCCSRNLQKSGIFWWNRYTYIVRIYRKIFLINPWNIQFIESQLPSNTNAKVALCFRVLAIDRNRLPYAAFEYNCSSEQQLNEEKTTSRILLNKYWNNRKKKK